MTQSATELPAAAETAERRKPALSPSRASDFKQCPLLYRFRAVDKIPETPSKAQVRGTLVHAVLERLFALPAEERVPARAKELVDPLWAELSAENPEWAALFSGDADDAATAESDWLASAGELLDTYFGLEDPSALEPQACEERVEVELGSGVRLRGYVDRIDVAETGEVRIVDYKTGAAPREIGEIKAMFQMKFYALVLWRLRGAVPDQLKLMYLTDGQSLTYTPDEAELRRFERTLEAIWQAILRAGKSGDFRPSKSKLCRWCDHQARCPEFGGTPPEYPGWPEPDGGDETVLDRAD
ncbi:RecB family exonuclease [Haloechinothrix salitolerans]|uniref:RecB family exonuclease n=1 Tax=Haloechinothrix salitolerans TaxID=926830 RepID=A0ABW2C230_9PSEU